MNLEKLTKEILSQSYNITTEAGEELTVIESGDVFDIIKRLASDGDLADVVGRSEQLCDHPKDKRASIKSHGKDFCWECGKHIEA